MLRSTVVFSFALLLLSILCNGQGPVSGEYDSGLVLAYDQATNTITGFYNNSTGFDEETEETKFSCTFYFKGHLNGKSAAIISLFPNQEEVEVIEGTIELAEHNTVSILLKEEHGGCWNVQHFTGNPVQFSLQQQRPWKQLRFVTVSKTHLYNSPCDINHSNQSAYLVKDDIVYIDKIDGDWAHCEYHNSQGKTRGWIRLIDVN